MPFGIDLGAFWEPKWMTLGAWGGPGSEKAILQKPLFYLRKTMLFEVRRPRGRPQIQTKCAPKPIQKTSLEIMRFSAILGPKMEPKWIQNRIQNRRKNRSENRAAFLFNGEVHGRSVVAGRRQWRWPRRRGRGGGKPPPEDRREESRKERSFFTGSHTPSTQRVRRIYDACGDNQPRAVALIRSLLSSSSLLSLLSLRSRCPGGCPRERRGSIFIPPRKFFWVGFWAKFWYVFLES